MQIDFYITEARTESATYPLLAKLISKEYTADSTVLILTRDLAQAKIIDDLLWSFDDISFIPHGINDAASPINISEQLPDNCPEILINLSSNIPDSPNCQRIIHIVDATNKIQLRSHFKFYKERKYPVQSHKL